MRRPKLATGTRADLHTARRHPGKPGVLTLPLVIASAFLLVLATGSAVLGSGSWPTGSADDTATSAPVAPALTVQEAGAAFLDGYVNRDGRVVRRDEGGDTVSEGQAYAMLVAAALGDERRFTAIWSWTKRNLLREDGLLSWHWQNGQVVDEQSASDADLDAARALVIAAGVFGNDQLNDDGVRLAKTILDQETVRTERGRILVAGSWVKGPPYAYNPSYASPAASVVLAKAFRDKRWSELDRGTRAVTQVLLNSSELPPDWAKVHADGRVDAMPSPSGSGGAGVRYAYDATRLPLRFAESCEPADVAFAARLAEPLDRFPGHFAARDLTGIPLTTEKSVVAATANAAALAARGDISRATAQLLDADQLQRAHPTYYGAAWGALARLLLTTNTLGGCRLVSS